MDRLLQTYPRVNDVTHACCLVVSNTFLPPVKSLGEIARSKLLCCKTMVYMRREHLHASLLYIGLEIFCLAVVERAVLLVVPCSLNRGVAHVMKTREQRGPTSLGLAVLVDVAHKVAHRVELQTQLLLHTLLLLGMSILFLRCHAEWQAEKECC